MSIALSTTPDLFRAFADATRLRILNLLLEGELCVCDLCEALDQIQPKVSRHLAYLRRTGLVDVRREGRWKYYRLSNRAEGLRRRLINCVKTCLRDFDVLQEDLQRLRNLDAGGCCT